MKTWLWWFAHNTLVHPLMGIFQSSKLLDRLHNWTAHKATLSEKPQEEHPFDHTMAMPAVRAGVSNVEVSVLVKLMGLHEAVDQFQKIGSEQLSIEANWFRARKLAIDRLETMVAEHFSDEDIRGLIQFYSSPLGLRFSAKQQETFHSVEDIVARLMDDAVGEGNS